uniref:Uncharacterized protein n=1 Tax=Guillardia theta TaxID=55529 RepID=A0A7S4P1U0_GUITH|mmetsp:Transcript_41475/g.130670  ORF Transcript_41475/g.130670 Transcript_41475/m.130670 type:complete len:129 (+) Transcript_41475:31-417(+)
MTKKSNKRDKPEENSKKSEVASDSAKKSKKGSKGVEEDELDDIFASKPSRSKQSESDKKDTTKGPDLKEIAQEANKYKGGGSSARKSCDGLLVYSEQELAKELGEEAWDAFMEASDPNLSREAAGCHW